MTFADNSTLTKLVELKHRIEFLRNDTDPDILIGAIERELITFIEFQCYTNKRHWAYHIKGNIGHSATFRLIRNSTKLEALYSVLEDLTRPRTFVKW